MRASYAPDKREYYRLVPDVIKIDLVETSSAPIPSDGVTVRVSPVFPLSETFVVPDLTTAEIQFFEFTNAFRCLGKIQQLGTPLLKSRVLFSYGACSVILICDSPQVLKDFKKLSLNNPKATEVWELKNRKVQKFRCVPAAATSVSLGTVRDYSTLPGPIKTIIDEFVASVTIVASKVDVEQEDRLKLFQGLVTLVDGFIWELTYFHTREGTPPDRFWTRNLGSLQQPAERQILTQQIIDRMTQINAALSYVTTQMYSGSVPILERRSLIRRNSLLGIGSALSTIERIVAYIEDALASVNFEELILDKMKEQRPLPGMEEPTFPIRTDWRTRNIDKLDSDKPTKPRVRKLAYYSSRYGFRESEFAITAALNSLWNGLSLEWSTMTITHEMLHSHVRSLLSYIFFLRDGGEDSNYEYFYDRFFRKVFDAAPVVDYSLIDSIRELIFVYCLRTTKMGSLSLTTESNKNFELEAPANFSDFYPLLRDEYRNISEIFVHVLDLHYFYGGRATKYIPLIWSSWSAVPSVRADIRQYVLRSLLALASKFNVSNVRRFSLAVAEFKSILKEYEGLQERIPILHEVTLVLNDPELLDAEYLHAFINSLILVDLAKEIFFSAQVAASLVDDEKISYSQLEDRIETEMSYDMPLGFFDDKVDCPIPYLFDRMLRVLRGELSQEGDERNLAISLLAMNSR